MIKLKSQALYENVRGQTPDDFVNTFDNGMVSLKNQLSYAWRELKDDTYIRRSANISAVEAGSGHTL
jgi:cellulose synthase/poly-beta-1,6-N-acetylglucosamine synthase-like glycosyltransferase